MGATYKLHVINSTVNQAALHYKMENVTPSNNWLDTAKRIGYFPKLSKYLRELEEEKPVKGLAETLTDMIKDGTHPKILDFSFKGRDTNLVHIPSSGESASLPTITPKSPIQKITKPKRPKS